MGTLFPLPTLCYFNGARILLATKSATCVALTRDLHFAAILGSICEFEVRRQVSVFAVFSQFPVSGDRAEVFGSDGLGAPFAAGACAHGAITGAWTARASLCFRTLAKLQQVSRRLSHSQPPNRSMRRHVNHDQRGTAVLAKTPALGHRLGDPCCRVSCCAPYPRVPTISWSGCGWDSARGSKPRNRSRGLVAQQG